MIIGSSQFINCTSPIFPSSASVHIRYWSSTATLVRSVPVSVLFVHQLSFLIRSSLIVCFFLLKKEGVRERDREKEDTRECFTAIPSRSPSHHISSHRLKNMAKNTIELPPKGGFSFDLCRRNAFLEKQGVKMPKFRKTGTTIVGLIFKVLSLSLSLSLPLPLF